MESHKEKLLRLWKARQTADGYDVSGVTTLEEAKHFFDKKEEEPEEQEANGISDQMEQEAENEEPEEPVIEEPVIDETLAEPPKEKKPKKRKKAKEV